MTATQKIKKNLLIKIGELPEYKLQEVLDFVNFILLHEPEHDSISRREKKGITSKNDSLKKFIGGVSHGSLAEKIDEELYGATETSC